MSKYIFLLVLFLGTVLAEVHAQGSFPASTISAQRTRIGKPNNAWFLVDIGGTSYKLDINDIASDKINNVTISNDSLYAVTNGIKTFVGKVNGGTGNGTGNGTSIPVNIYTVSQTLDGKHQDLSFYIGSATVAGVQVVSPTGQPFNANGSDNFVMVKDGDSLRIHYAAAPKGPVNFQFSLIGQIPTSGHAFIKYGALPSLGTSQLNMNALANMQLQYARVSYNGGAVASYTDYTLNGYKVMLSYNTAPPVQGNYTPLPTDTTAAKAKLDSLLSANPVNNIIGLAFINEMCNIRHGQGYWNPIGGARNTINLINAYSNIAHAHGLLSFDGGFSSDIVRFLVWEDFNTRGHSDSAALYLAKAFPSGTNLSGWRSDTSHGYRIAYTDSIVAALPTMHTDRVNLHWYETVRDADSLSSTLDPFALRATVAYLQRKSGGKKVISTEMGMNNTNNAAILSQLIDACQSMFNSSGNMEYVFWYNSDAPYQVFNTDASLSIKGMALKNKIIQVQSN